MKTWNHPASWLAGLLTMVLAAAALRPLFAQSQEEPTASPLATSACREVLDALEGSEGIHPDLTYARIQTAYELLEDEALAAEWDRLADEHPSNLVASNLRTAFGRVRYLFHESFGDCASRPATEAVERSDQHVHVLNRTIDLHRRALVCVASLPL